MYKRHVAVHHEAPIVPLRLPFVVFAHKAPFLLLPRVIYTQAHAGMVQAAVKAMKVRITKEDAQWHAGDVRGLRPVPKVAVL